MIYPRACFSDTYFKKLHALRSIGRKGLPLYQKIVFEEMHVEVHQLCQQPMLAFLLYDTAMARQISAGLSIAERKGLGADIIESNKHYSESYWRVEQDLNCDVVRQMAALCDDANAETEKGKALYNWCHEETERRLDIRTFS